MKTIFEQMLETANKGRIYITTKTQPECDKILQAMQNEFGVLGSMVNILEKSLVRKVNQTSKTLYELSDLVAMISKEQTDELSSIVSNHQVPLKERNNQLAKKVHTLIEEIAAKQVVYIDGWIKAMYMHYVESQKPKAESTPEGTDLNNIEATGRYRQDTSKTNAPTPAPKSNAELQAEIEGLKTRLQTVDDDNEYLTKCMSGIKTQNFALFKKLEQASNASLLRLQDDINLLTKQLDQKKKQLEEESQLHISKYVPARQSSPNDCDCSTCESQECTVAEG
jgi:gas vesicle protein